MARRAQDAGREHLHGLLGEQPGGGAGGSQRVLDGLGEHLAGERIEGEVGRDAHGQGGVRVQTQLAGEGGGVDQPQDEEIAAVEGQGFSFDTPNSKLGDKAMIEKLRIRSADPADADELLAIRRDAIMALAEEYGRVAAERWASGAAPDRAAKAIATNSVWVTECGSMVLGWVEVSGATIESLYVSAAAARRGVGSSLLAHAERHIHATGASVAYLDASPNAEPFYARRGYQRIGAVKANNSIPMSKRLDVSAA